MTVAIDVRKQRERLLWSSGNYAAVAQLIVEPALQLVERIHVGPEMRVLDVATGTGNVAIAAARKGASVIGLDLTPELLEKARARSRAAGVEADWQEGDAERLPFDDNSFDRVLSTFGVQFAPDQCRAAAELVRVCRPGGLIGVCSWTREGVAGQYIELLMRRVGSRDVGSSPTDWGNEDCVRRLFAGAVDELSFELDRVVTEHESVDASMEFLEHNYGCAITLRRKLAPEGRWEALREEIRELFASANQATDTGFLEAAEYLRVVARKA